MPEFKKAIWHIGVTYLNLVPEKHPGKNPTETQLLKAEFLCCFRQASQNEQYV